MFSFDYEDKYEDEIGDGGKGRNVRTIPRIKHFQLSLNEPEGSSGPTFFCPFQPQLAGEELVAQADD